MASNSRADGIPAWEVESFIARPAGRGSCCSPTLTAFRRFVMTIAALTASASSCSSISVGRVRPSLIQVTIPTARAAWIVSSRSSGNTLCWRDALVRPVPSGRAWPTLELVSQRRDELQVVLLAQRRGLVVERVQELNLQIERFGQRRGHAQLEIQHPVLEVIDLGHQVGGLPQLGSLGELVFESFAHAEAEIDGAGVSANVFEDHAGANFTTEKGGRVLDEIVTNQRAER